MQSHLNRVLFVGGSIHRLSTVYPPSIHRLSTIYPPSIHRLSTVYPPSIHRLSTIYPPSIHRLYTQANRLSIGYPPSIRLSIYALSRPRFSFQAIYELCLSDEWISKSLFFKPEYSNRAGVLSTTYFWEVTQTCMFMKKKNLLIQENLIKICVGDF